MIDEIKRYIKFKTYFILGYIFLRGLLSNIPSSKSQRLMMVVDMKRMQSTQEIIAQYEVTFELYRMQNLYLSQHQLNSTLRKDTANSALH